MCLLLTANVSFCLKDLENQCQSLLFGSTMLSWINYLTNNFKCGFLHGHKLDPLCIGNLGVLGRFPNKEERNIKGQI